jgi:hypothetical protein
MKKTESINVSSDLLHELNKRKTSADDSYEDVIWDVIEASTEVNEVTKRRIANARQQFREGKFKTLEEVKRKFL